MKGKAIQRKTVSNMLIRAHEQKAKETHKLKTLMAAIDKWYYICPRGVQEAYNKITGIYRPII